MSERRNRLSETKLYVWNELDLLETSEWRTNERFLGSYRREDLSLKKGRLNVSQEEEGDEALLQGFIPQRCSILKNKRKRKRKSAERKPVNAQPRCPWWVPGTDDTQQEPSFGGKRCNSVNIRKATELHTLNRRIVDKAVSQPTSSNCRSPAPSASTVGVSSMSFAQRFSVISRSGVKSEVTQWFLI